MIIDLLSILTITLAIIGLIIYIFFLKGEGKDERGEMIMARASNISMSFLTLFFIIFIWITSYSDITVEWLGLLAIASFSILIFIQGISIIYLKKRI